MHKNINLNLLLKAIILILILITFSGLLFPITSASYSAYYGSIAKHIAITNDWSDLILSNQDWLDKPHFPFWITAASFKIFGINSFAYILPGFLFHLLGAYYTYKLTKLLYTKQVIALLAVVIYLSVFHLLISAIDVRAEAYLLGEIMGASYYLLLYDKKFSWKYLFLGCFFTALALMTKGLFVIVTIISGLLGLWLYQKRLINLIHPKWWLALFLALVLAFPEYIALYLQFDSHPEKIIFGHSQVSGIRWFFLDSQFGRFFNTGYIMSTNPMPFHQLFFVHTFLWAFLPWTLVYPWSIFCELKQFKTKTQEHKNALIILLAYFFTSLIMFSLTSFQVDHYTNIIFPFAAILCAKFLSDNWFKASQLFNFQLSLAYLLLALSFILCGLVFTGLVLAVLIGLELIILIVMVYYCGEIKSLKSLIYSLCAISFLFVNFMFANGYIYHQYDTGAVVANYTNQSPQIPVVDYGLNSEALEFYTKAPYYRIHELNLLPSLKQFYLVTPVAIESQVAAKFKNNLQLITQVHGNTNDQVFPYLLNQKELNQHLKTYKLYLITR